MQQVFNGQASDGNSDEVAWNGGIGSFWVSGTFSGATVKLQASPDNGTTWFDVGDECTLTAAGVAAFQLGSGATLRANLSGTGSPAPSIKAWIG